MLQLVGAVLLMAGAGAVGFCYVAKLNARVQGLEHMRAALQFMERELAFSLTPMGTIFKALSQWEEPPVGAFFARCHRGLTHLNEENLDSVWRTAAAEELPMLQSEDVAVLSALGAVLGRYDGEGQQKSLALTLERLGHCIENAKSERDRLGKVYGVLTLSVGAFLVILLL
ncbi:MAG: stage III sporulation protein AB [Oscillospiraceae bacterium]